MEWHTVLSGSVVPVVVALIGAWAVIRKHDSKSDERNRKFREENSRQHSAVETMLGHLSTQVGSIDSKVTRVSERVDGLAERLTVHELESR